MRHKTEVKNSPKIGNDKISKEYTVKNPQNFEIIKYPKKLL